MSKEYLDKTGLAHLWSKIKNYIKDKDIRTATPVGGSIDWYGPESTIPSDWMREDGRSLSKTQYPELFAVIGYTYGGSGDNFNIPNSKGRVNVHLNENDTEFNALAKLYGSKTHTLTVAQLPSHEHGFEGYIYKDPEGGYDKVLIYGRPQGSAYTNWGTKSTGDNQPHNNIQPSIVSYKIIKVKEDAASRDLRLLDNEVTSISNQLIEIRKEIAKNKIECMTLQVSVDDVQANTWYYLYPDYTKVPGTIICSYVLSIAHYQHNDNINGFTFIQGSGNRVAWVRLKSATNTPSMGTSIAVLYHPTVEE